MSFAETAYTFFTFSLAAVMAGIMVYYFNPKRKKEVEEPKYRMLRDDQ
ncbi:MAG: cbb3-type cytochrome c oxidase subunit 3 [Chlorobiaceae bacterium]|jgi:cbb3-type cytochrome oxidase subunit 3|nr:cbb3-type cytochrome c oxidase subunit 3 [Chlorobiaceae bacterium]